MRVGGERFPGARWCGGVRLAGRQAWAEMRAFALLGAGEDDEIDAGKQGASGTTAAPRAAGKGAPILNALGVGSRTAGPSAPSGPVSSRAGRLSPPPTSSLKLKRGRLSPEQKRKMEQMVPEEMRTQIQRLKDSRNHELDTSQYVDPDELLAQGSDTPSIRVEDGRSFKDLSSKDRALCRRVVLFLSSVLEERASLPPELRREAYESDKSTLAVSCATFDKPIMRTMAKFTDEDQKVRQQRKEFQDAERKLAKIRLDMGTMLPEGLTEIEQRMTKSVAATQFKKAEHHHLHQSGVKAEVDAVVKEVIHDYRAKSASVADDKELTSKISRETDELRRLKQHAKGQIVKDIAMAKAHSNSIIRYMGVLAEKNAAAASPLMTTTFIVRRLPMRSLQALAQFMADMNEFALILFSRVVREAMGDSAIYMEAVHEASADITSSPPSPAARSNQASPSSQRAKRQISRIEVAQRDVNAKHRPGLETIKHIRDYAHRQSSRSSPTRSLTSSMGSPPPANTLGSSTVGSSTLRTSMAFEPVSLKAAGSARFSSTATKGHKPYKKLVADFYSSKQKKLRERRAEEDEYERKYHMVVQEPVETLRRPRTSTGVERKVMVAHAKLFEDLCIKFGSTRLGGGKVHVRSSHRQWTSSHNVFKTATNVSGLAQSTKAQAEKQSSSKGRYVTDRSMENPNCMCLTCWKPLGEGCFCERPFISRFERTEGFWVDALQGRIPGYNEPIKPFVVTPSRDEEDSLKGVTKRLQDFARLSGRKYETIPVIICSRCWFVVGSECECSAEECIPIALDEAYRAAPVVSVRENPGNAAIAKRSMSVRPSKGWGKASKTVTEEVGQAHQKKIGRIVQDNPRICSICWHVLGMGCLCARPKLFYSTDLVQAVVNRRAAMRAAEAEMLARRELEILETQAVETNQYDSFNKFLEERRTSSAVSAMDGAAICQWLAKSGFEYLVQTVSSKGIDGKDLDRASERELVDMLGIDDMLAYRLRVALDIASGEDVLRGMRATDSVKDQHLKGFYDTAVTDLKFAQSELQRETSASSASSGAWTRMKSVHTNRYGKEELPLGEVARFLGRIGFEQKAYLKEDGTRPKDAIIAKSASAAAHRVLRDQGIDPTSKYKAKLFDHSVQTINGDGRFHWNPPARDARLRLTRGDKVPEEPEPEVEDLLPPEWEAGMLRIYTQLTHESEHFFGIKKLRKEIRKVWDEIHQIFAEFCRVPCFEQIPIDKDATGFYWPYDKEPKVMYSEQFSRFAVQSGLLSSKVCLAFLQRKFLPELEYHLRSPFYVPLDSKGQPIKVKTAQKSAKEQMVVELEHHRRYAHGPAFGVHDVVQFCETLIRARHYNVISGKGLKTKGETTGKDAELWKQFSDCMSICTNTVLSGDFDIPLYHRLFYSSLVQSILGEFELPLWALFRQFAAFKYEEINGKVTWTAFTGSAATGKSRCFDTMCVNELVTIAQVMEMVNADINFEVFFRVVKEVMCIDKLFAGVHPNNNQIDLTFHEFKQILVHNTGQRFKKQWVDQRGIKECLTKVCQDFRAWGSRNLPYSV